MTSPRPPPGDWRRRLWSSDTQDIRAGPLVTADHPPAAIVATFEIPARGRHRPGNATHGITEDARTPGNIPGGAFKVSPGIDHRRRMVSDHGSMILALITASAATLEPIEA